MVHATIAGFDVLGRPLKQHQQFFTGSWSSNYTVQRTYDLAGNVLTQTYPSGHTVHYAYDGSGRISSFTGNLGEGVLRSYATDFQYTPWGTQQQEKFGTTTPLYHKQRYNARGQLWDMRLSTVAFSTDAANGDRGAIVNHYSTTYVQGGSGVDNNGNLRRQEIYIPGGPFFQDTFAYDQLNRLTSISEKLNGTGADTFKQAYTVDRWGNRTIDQANTTGDVPRPEHTVDETTNRLNAPDGYLYEYDEAGNQTLDNTLGSQIGQRIFDAENRIIAAKKSKSGPWQWAYYTYNGDGQRVRRKVMNFEIWQVYGFEGELLAEYPQTGASVAVSHPQKEYGYRNAQLLVTAEPFTNLAWDKPATQIDNFSLSTTAAKAVNGNVDGDLANGHASATNSHLNSWWQVDLQTVQAIDSITVWGRTDCCPETSSNFHIFVSDSPFTSYDLNTTIQQLGVSNYPQPGYAGPISQTVNRTGRYIRVQIVGTQALALGEVQVWNAQANVSWLMTDHLGTPRIIADRTGSTGGISRHDYLPFGEEIVGLGGRTITQGYLGNSVRQKFTLKERDNETGLDYFLARYYSSAQGRFTSPDEFKGGPNELWVLGSGHPEKQALVYAEVTNPQSLNKYQYCFNNPLRYVDPDGQDPQDSFENKMQQAIKDLNSGRITEEQYWDRLRGAGVGAAAGVAVIVAARGGAAGLTALATWATRNPDKVEQIAQGLQEAAGGPPGLTLSPSTRLSSAEISTGGRLAKQLGVGLQESAHEGAEYVVAGAKNISIDAMGGTQAYQHFGDGKKFLESVVHHVNKSVNYVAIDLKGASKTQIKTIENHVSSLTKEQQNKIIYVR